MIASGTPPSVTWSFLIFRVIGVTDVIGSIPSTSTSASCSTKARIALSSPRRFSTSPSAIPIRARWATRRTVSLSTDMNRCLRGVHARSYSRGPNARQRHRRDLAGHHRIVRMTQPSVRTSRHQLFPGNDDNANRPAASERRQYPKPPDLEEHHDGQKQRLDWAIIGQGPHSDQPSGMDKHNQHKVRSAVFHAAGSEQPAFVLSRPPQLGNPLEREKSEERRAPTEFDHSSTAAKYAEKPGPNAASKCGPHAPR